MDALLNQIQEVRLFFQSGRTLPWEVRIQALRDLRSAVAAREEKILKALYADLGKHAFEAYETEVGIVLSEIRHTVKNLPRWAKPQRRRTPISLFRARSRVFREPYGVVLVMSPWNYPFQLALTPLIGAVAAGNAVVLKPSSQTPHTSEQIRLLAEEVFAPGHVLFVHGGSQSQDVLLQERFDLIFFTGSETIGKQVMKAASKHLTPVILELGGKSPCIVERTADIELAAKRIAWGKFLNAGQTCIAPDYVLVQREVQDSLVDALGRVLKEFYGEDPLSSRDLGRIINEKHFERLRALLTMGRVAIGGKTDSNALRIEPTVLTDPDIDSALMREEIFGPILPLLSFDTVEEAMYEIGQRPKPLALYLFTKDNAVRERVLRGVSFGGGCVNDTVTHLANPHLPFGGVGNSGMGAYHGEEGFRAFSHEKGVLMKSAWPDIPLRYPPSDGKLPLLKRFLK